MLSQIVLQTVISKKHMQLIDDQDKTRIVQILSNSFQSNPNILAIVKPGSNVNDRVTRLCEFCVDLAHQRVGVFKSYDACGAVLMFRNDKKIGVFSLISLYIRLGNLCVGWDRAIAMLKRESLIKSRRYSEPHLYFWMLAIIGSNHVHTIKEIKKESFEISKSLRLPIVAETSDEKMKRVYTGRYGFELYNQIRFEKENYTLWFFIRHYDCNVGVQ